MVDGINFTQGKRLEHSWPITIMAVDGITISASVYNVVAQARLTTELEELPPLFFKQL